MDVAKAETVAPAGQVHSADSEQYLTFILNGEEYGVDILKVQNIQGYGKVTPLPHSPAYVKGVVNLRGSIVPIVDLRKRFGMEEIEVGPTTVVIVVKVQASTGERTVGLVVDAVSEVHDVYSSQRKAAPEFGSSVSSAYIEALATIDERMIILLNIDELVNSGILQEVGASLEMQAAGL
jgi:purine-binding chemotaxis protein CheW